MKHAALFCYLKVKGPFCSSWKLKMVLLLCFRRPHHDVGQSTSFVGSAQFANQQLDAALKPCTELTWNNITQHSPSFLAYSSRRLMNDFKCESQHSIKENNFRRISSLFPSSECDYSKLAICRAFYSKRGGLSQHGEKKFIIFWHLDYYYTNDFHDVVWKV